MRRLKYISMLTVALVAVAIGCKDESLNPYIPPLGNAHGLIQFVSAADGSLNPPIDDFYDQSAVDYASFFDENVATATQEINAKLTWISIDNRVTISSIELYLEYDESYSDADRNPLVASHGGPSPKPSVPAGKFWKSITPGANREAIDIKVTGDDVYQLFKDAKFDYGAGEVGIFDAHPYNADFNRSDPTHRFWGERTLTIAGKGDIDLPADVFRINWRLIGDDGTAYGSWTPSVCQELVGANCTGQWMVNSNVYNPNATLKAKNGVPMKSGATEEITITFDNSIATAPSITLTPNQGSVGAVTPVSGKDNEFTVVYTANGYTGSVSMKVSGAVSGGSGPTSGLVQNSKTMTLTVDNTNPVAVSTCANSSCTTTRVGRGLSATITVTFNEAMSTKTGEEVLVSITGQNVDDVTNAKMTLASNGLSATYLYLWKDSSVPFDNTQGTLNVTISGGKDKAGNTFGGSGTSLVNDVGTKDLTKTVWVQDPGTGAYSSTTKDVEAVNVAPTLAFNADLGTQLRWTITQGSAGSSSTSGTWFWVALAWKDTNADLVLDQPTAPGQFVKDLQGLANPVYNGFYTGSAAISPFAVTASGSTTSSGTNFTTFTANGTFDIYVYFVSATGNISPMSAPMTFTMNP